jgi:hypothetical protein
MQIKTCAEQKGQESLPIQDQLNMKLAKFNCDTNRLREFEQRIAEKRKLTRSKLQLEDEELLQHTELEGPRMDSMLRYGTSLDRELDHAVSRLERLQRIRRGQPVAPEINLRVTQNP